MTVDWVRNGADGNAALANAEHALVLLDIGLPGMSVIDVLRTARTEGYSVPVLIITARDGLSSGAGAKCSTMLTFSLCYGNTTRPEESCTRRNDRQPSESDGYSSNP
jgi:CheY-like chemotaxis protein